MLKFVLKILFSFCAFASIVMLLPGSILLDINPRKFLHPLPKSLTGALRANERLAEADVQFENQLLGPESLAVFDGKVVTGTRDGFLYQIEENSVKPLVKLVEHGCALNYYNVTKCGRPLGLKFDSKGVLYVVEPSIGVFSVEDVFGKKPKVNLVLNIDRTKELGRASKFLDDLAIEEGAGRDGGHVLYISDVSQKFDHHQANLIIMGSDTGRLIRYDVNADKLETLLDKLLFPNGVELNDDGSAVFVNEFVARQVIKVYIKGPKKGQSEPLIQHLPGEPDNIRRSASKNKETYWLALLSARTSMKSNELDYYIRKPLLRKLICRVMHIYGTGVELIGKIVQSQLIAEYGHDVKNGRYFDFLFTSKSANDYGMIIEVDAEGNVVDSLHASDQTFTRLSEVREVVVSDTESTLLVGSFINPYLLKLRHTR